MFTINSSKRCSSALWPAKYNLSTEISTKITKRKPTYTHACMCTNAHAHTHTHAHSHAYTHAHTHTHIPNTAHQYTHTHTTTHSKHSIPIHTHTHTTTHSKHRHTHTLIYSLLLSQSHTHTHTHTHPSLRLSWPPPGALMPPPLHPDRKLSRRHRKEAQPEVTSRRPSQRGLSGSCATTISVSAS